MAGETLHVRFQRGDTVVELEGDATAVLHELSQLHGGGLGPLLEFFKPATTAPPTAPSVTTSGSLPTGPLASPARTLRFVVNSLTIPGSASAADNLALDLDGDGRRDNQLGGFLAALASVGVTGQPSVDQAIASGGLIVLLILATEQSVLTADQHADLTISRGVSGTAPTPSLGVPFTLTGRLKAGHFTSDPPAIGSAAPRWVLDLPLFGPGVSIGLPIEGPRVECDVDPAGKSLTRGRLAGSVPGSDVGNLIVPALAAALNATLAASPSSPAGLQIAAAFDIGGGKNPDGSTASAGDGIIDASEVASNPLVASLLSPDVQMRDASGRYAPVPNGGAKDSLSIGLGFTAASSVT